MLDADVDVMEISPEKFIPCKRRAVKVKEQLDDIFLRRSKTTALKLHGFKKVSIHSQTCVHNTHITHIENCTHTSHTRVHTRTNAENSLVENRALLPVENPL